MLVGAVAVANFYGFLLRRLTLTTASPLKNAARGSRVSFEFPEHFGEVSSHV
jgi:kynureninase